MTVRERTIERALVAGVQALGGRAFKFVSPGFNGAPDRIVLIPGFVPFFVELKAPKKGRLSTLQIRAHTLLLSLGVPVYVFKTEAEVSDLLEGLRCLKSSRRKITSAT